MVGEILIARRHKRLASLGRAVLQREEHRVHENRRTAARHTLTRPCYFASLGTSLPSRKICSVALPSADQRVSFPFSLPPVQVASASLRPVSSYSVIWPLSWLSVSSDCCRNLPLG